jgi:uncharacterized protein
MQDMIERTMKTQLTDRLATSPAVSLGGARQCGKTTLAKSFAGHYFDVEQETDRLRLDLNWHVLVRSPELIILDEAQTWPDLFVRLRGTIDADRQRNGRFLLLGSVSPALMHHVSESLAGRLALLELTPFIWAELSAEMRTSLWLCGGFPDGGVRNPKQYPNWQRDFLALLTQRDLPHWGLPAKPQVLERFARMLAAAHGQSWNASQIGESMGLDHKTVNTYLDFLIGAFLIRKLAPYQTNIRKRLVKSPKVYWRDSGLLHALLNVPDQQNLLAQPWVGASWEGFVIEQILNTLTALGKRADSYYFRTSDKQELDLVLDWGIELWAIEIKLGASPARFDMERLNRTADLIQAQRRFLISNTPTPAGDARCMSCNLESFLQEIGP